MVGLTLLIKHEKYSLSVRQFEEGAIDAAREQGITVIIDNFRASNTILTLFQYTDDIIPVEHVEEALQFDDRIKVGEIQRNFDHFDFDNSPVIINENANIFKGRKIVIRTSNGTRGLVNAIGSNRILVGAFRNLDRVVDFCSRKLMTDTPISFVAMGSGDIPRIEDIYGAKMMYYKLLHQLGDSGYQSEDNPWLIDWVSEIRKNRKFDAEHRADREYCVQLNKTDLLPSYNPVTKRLELIK